MLGVRAKRPAEAALIPQNATGEPSPEGELPESATRVCVPDAIDAAPLALSPITWIANLQCLGGLLRRHLDLAKINVQRQTPGRGVSTANWNLLATREIAPTTQCPSGSSEG